MISCEQLFNVFNRNDLKFFTGVPDSTFKDWMSFLAYEHEKRITNIIACNECEAVAIAAGYHLATKKVGVVYMQNSGEGKAVNPLTSLCDPDVYSIPVLLIIGWRGQPGEHDEPQHKKMGKITLELLNTLDIPHAILSDNLEGVENQIIKMKLIAESQKRPVALIVKSGLLEEYPNKNKNVSSLQMKREDAIKEVIDSLNGDEVIVSTTGKTSRELFEYRVNRKEDPRDFYTVGSMGCASSIANAIALQKPNKRVIIFDGDGAALMQMGSLATIGYYGPSNLFHIIFDNQCYDSTGEQPSVSKTVDFCKIALACGYKYANVVESKEELKNKVSELVTGSGPAMIVVRVSRGSRKNLGRPTKTPIENKESFMGYLER